MCKFWGFLQWCGWRLLPSSIWWCITGNWLPCFYQI